MTQQQRFEILIEAATRANDGRDGAALDRAAWNLAAFVWTNRKHVTIAGDEAKR